MINLLVIDEILSDSLLKTSFGGAPVKAMDKDFDWPKCSTCNSEMQFLGKITCDIGVEMIFMCNTNPGMCDEWDADEGGNKVIVEVAKNLEFAKSDNPETTLRETEYGAKILELNFEHYDEARDSYTGNRTEVLGQIFGEPDWIQGDETPNCNCCGEKMRFVAQLEEGPDYRTAMNFGGGGVGYLFDCPKGKTGKFLWQC